MKTNNFERSLLTEDSYESLHGIKPRIETMVINHKQFIHRIRYKDKEVFLEEILDRGLTKLATLTYGGKVCPFKSVYEAEQAANKILKEEENGDNI